MSDSLRMSNSSANSSDLFSRESRRLETILAEFEAAWFRGERPEIADYLEGDSDQQFTLLVELVHTDLEIRLKREEAARVEQYLGQFPQLADSQEQLIELVLFEFKLRQRTEAVSAAEYVARFPEVAQELVERLPHDSNTSAAPKVDRPRELSVTPSSDGIASLSIQVVSGPHRGVRFETAQHNTILIGRGSDAQLQLIDDPHFSRFHCRLEMAPPHCRLIDLNSSNGTYVNGQRIETAYLRNGDVISGGMTRLLVTIQHQPAESAAEPSKPPAVDESQSGSPLPAVPGYETQQFVGAGTCGTVYRAMELDTGGPVAVKLMHAPRSENPSGMIQFIQRMSRLASLQHPGIVSIREAGVACDRPFVVTDFVEAVSFDDVLRAEQQPARDRLVCRIVSRLLDALDSAHRQSLAHGNIKPSNVLLMAVGRRLSVRLCDFGLAAQWMDSNLSSIAAAPRRVMDLAFMSPEQIRDCRQTSPAVDIYATGVLLYYLLTGTIPFDASSERILFDQILSCQRVPLGSRRPHIAPELIAIVERAMHHSADDRFESASQMRDALCQFSRT